MRNNGLVDQRGVDQGRGREGLQEIRCKPGFNAVELLTDGHVQRHSRHTQQVEEGPHV